MTPAQRKREAAYKRMLGEAKDASGGAVKGYWSPRYKPLLHPRGVSALREFARKQLIEEGVRNAVTAFTSPTEGGKVFYGNHRFVCMGFWESNSRRVGHLLYYPTPIHTNNACMKHMRAHTTPDAIEKMLSQPQPELKVHLKYLNFILKDPLFGQAFREKSIKAALRNGLLVNIDMPQWIVHPALICIRAAYEFPGKIQAWDTLVKKGVSPRLALLLADCVVFPENIGSQGFTVRPGGKANYSLGYFQRGHYAFRWDIMSVKDIQMFARGLISPRNTERYSASYRHGYASTSSAFINNAEDFGPRLSRILAGVEMPCETIFLTRDPWGASVEKTCFGWETLDDLCDTLVELVIDHNLEGKQYES